MKKIIFATILAFSTMTLAEENVKPKRGVKSALERILGSGNEGGGGGTTLDYRLIEEYRRDIKTLPAWINIIAPVLQSWKRRFPGMETFLNDSYRSMKFYFVPVTLNEISEKVTGIPFRGQQTAVQCGGVVFVNSNLFDEQYKRTKSRRGQAGLLIHELALNAKMQALLNCDNVGPKEHEQTRDFEDIYFNYVTANEDDVQNKMIQSGWEDPNLLMSSRKIHNDQVWAKDAAAFRPEFANIIQPFCSDPTFPRTEYLNEVEAEWAFEVIKSMQRSIVQFLFRLRLIDGEKLERLGVSLHGVEQIQVIGKFYHSDLNDRYKLIARNAIIARVPEELYTSDWHTQKLENGRYSDLETPNPQPGDHPTEKSKRAELSALRKRLRFWIDFCQNYQANMPLNFEKDQMLDINEWAVSSEIRWRAEAPCYTKDCAAKMEPPR